MAGSAPKRQRVGPDHLKGNGRIESTSTEDSSIFCVLRFGQKMRRYPGPSNMPRIWRRAGEGSATRSFVGVEDHRLMDLFAEAMHGFRCLLIEGVPLLAGHA